MVPLLTNKRILVVEDEHAIAMLITEMLESIGTPDPVIAMSLTEGMRWVESQDFHLVLLDLNLSGEASFPIAEYLKEHKIPFVFVTGYDLSAYTSWRNWPTVTKPFPQAGLKAAMEHALRQQS